MHARCSLEVRRPVTGSIHGISAALSRRALAAFKNIPGPNLNSSTTPTSPTTYAAHGVTFGYKADSCLYATYSLRHEAYSESEIRG